MLEAMDGGEGDNSAKGIYQRMWTCSKGIVQVK